MTTAKKWYALLGLSLCGFIASLDFTIINTALPSIQSNLTLTTGELQWVMNIFVLVICILSATMGRLGDIFGQRWILYIGMFIFAISCLIAGLAQNAFVIILSRALQGMGIAMVIPAALALISYTFIDDQKHRAIGIWTSIRSIAMALGPVAGGIIVTKLNWRWVFWVNVPILLVSIIICLLSIEEVRDKTHSKKIDWLGFCFLSLGLASFTIAIIQMPDWGWHSFSILSLFIIAIFSFIVLFIVERKVETPIPNLHLFTNPTFLCSAVINFTILFFAYTVFFLAPLYLQNVHNKSPEVVGFMLLPISLAMMVTAASADFINSFIRISRLIYLSLILFALSAVLQLIFNASTELFYVEAILILMGIAWGLMGIAWGIANVFSISAAISALPLNTAGAASGALSTIRNMGGTIGLAIAITIFRYKNNSTLNKHLATEGIQLNHQQQQLITSYLSEPAKAQDLLTQFGHRHEALSLFKKAFMKGYFSTMELLFFLCLFVLLFTFFMIKRKKAFSNGDSSEKKA